MDGYEAIEKILKLEGVEWLACFPSNPLIEAVAKEGIRPIMFRQERGGIMAADGYSRTMNSSKFGVFACQGGPGAENVFPEESTRAEGSNAVPRTEGPIRT